VRVLVVEDDRALADLLVRTLQRAHWAADIASDGRRALAALHTNEYDLVVLDLGLPDMDGVEVCRQWRASGGRVPILILTARGALHDRVTGLDAGADDYVVKPFAMTELAARLRALLRRPGRSLTAVIAVGKLRLDVTSRQISVNGSTVHFSAREIEAMEMLMRREGQVVSRSSLEGGLYGLSRSVSGNSVEVLISRLRRRLSTIDAGCAIHTLHGIGYLLKERAP
jgi:DNA-binding response OmpR family regulator